MGQVFYGTEPRPRDPFTSADPFDPWPMTRWPTVCSERYKGESYLSDSGVGWIIDVSSKHL